MNTIYTVAIGDRYTKTRWARDCLKAWEHYCDRHNLNLHVQTKATHPFKAHSEDPKFEKFNFIHQVHPEFPQEDRRRPAAVGPEGDARIAPGAPWPAIQPGALVVPRRSTQNRPPS
ncbi:MAG: hypothetical protein OXU96_09160 [Gammaproteobacteria bacterium]|nr:hypothetical protein [Gammaproteobacteria bacterium]